MHKPELLPLFVFGTLLITAFAVVFIVSIIIQKHRQVHAQLDQQSREFEYSQNLLNTKIEVRDSTLNTIAQELHDNIAQVLTASFFQLNKLEQISAANEAKTLANETKTTIKKAISDIRLLSHSLATGLVEQRDIEDSIKSELLRIESLFNFKCELLSEALYDPNPEERLLIFRIVQEALQNIVKHSKATEVWITISSTNEQYSLTVEDNGTGFKFDRNEITNSLGLLNMHERARMLKADLLITSELNRGTKIVLQYPINTIHENNSSSSG